MRISDSLSYSNEFPVIAATTARLRGFTLIEILVVLLVITILTGVTVTRLPALSRNTDFDLETRRLELLLNMARNEAMLDSAEFGFRLTKTGYVFFRYDDRTQSWQPVEPPFHERALPEEVRLSLRADKPEFGLSGKNIPPLLILSSGETTPVELVMESRSDDLRKTLVNDGYAEFIWNEDE